MQDFEKLSGDKLALHFRNDPFYKDNLLEVITEVLMHFKMNLYVEKGLTLYSIGENEEKIYWNNYDNAKYHSAVRSLIPHDYECEECLFLKLRDIKSMKDDAENLVFLLVCMATIENIRGEFSSNILLKSLNITKTNLQEKLIYLQLPLPSSLYLHSEYNTSSAVAKAQNNPWITKIDIKNIRYILFKPKNDLLVDNKPDEIESFQIVHNNNNAIKVVLKTTNKNTIISSLRGAWYLALVWNSKGKAAHSSYIMSTISYMTRGGE